MQCLQKNGRSSETILVMKWKQNVLLCSVPYWMCLCHKSEGRFTDVSWGAGGVLWRVEYPRFQTCFLCAAQIYRCVSIDFCVSAGQDHFWKISRLSCTSGQVITAWRRVHCVGRLKIVEHGTQYTRLLLYRQWWMHRVSFPPAQLTSARWILLYYLLSGKAIMNRSLRTANTSIKHEQRG